MEKKSDGKPAKKRLCPFVQKPSEDCYCIKTISQYIEKTVYYCSKNFEACEIYKTKYPEKYNGESV